MNIKYKLIEYYQVYASGLHSNTVETIVNINDPSKGVSLAFGVKILNSQFELPLTIDSMSCINRSVVDGFFDWVHSHILLIPVWEGFVLLHQDAP